MGTGVEVKALIAEALAIVDASGLPYKLGAMQTTIEGDADQVMDVIMRCHRRLLELSCKMAKTNAVPATVLETILEWSNDRPLWQRDALRRIVSNGQLASADIAELVSLCKQGRGDTSTALTAVPLERAHLPANPDLGESVSLVSIAEVDGVNNLAPLQTLPFELNGITIVYGNNGAGKSGYARILKRACRARHAGRIEPNAYNHTAAVPPPPATASITFTVGGKPLPPAKWVDSAVLHPQLSAVSVFDSSCASVHINEKNEVAFRPFGLDVPDELANACQQVRDVLTAEQKQLERSRNPVFSSPSWKDFTVVGKVLSALRYDTNNATICALGTLSDEEVTRRARLTADLSQDLAKAAAEQTLKADSIQRLLTSINQLAEETADAVLMSTWSLDVDTGIKRKAARLASQRAFSGEAIPGVGGEVWRSLWESARRYSEQVAYPSQPFPLTLEDTVCTLCQQPLSEDARERMMRFESFIRDDIERQAEAGEAGLLAARQALVSVAISTRSLKANLQELALCNPEAARSTRRFIAQARLRRYVLLRVLGTAEELVLTNSAQNPAASIELVERSLRVYAAELQQSAADNQRKKLERDLAELSDRYLLGGILETVENEIERLKGLRFLEQCLPDTATNGVTYLGNSIADTVITPHLRDRFKEEIMKLAAEKVRVDIVRTGGKYGSPQYQVQLLTKSHAKVKDILSEGEQTCVGLAAFLTELATAVHASTLVFDDPVSSLDHLWRKRVAERLVEEAANRQIIVFTHDLILVHDLIDIAAEQARLCQCVTVSRGKAGAGNITPGLPWKAKRVEDRIDQLEKASRNAKDLFDQSLEDEYATDVVKIYNDLRATWERALEEVAFFRVIMRHRDYIDTKELKKTTALTEADCDAFRSGFKRCCDVTDATTLLPRGTRGSRRHLQSHAI